MAIFYHNIDQSYDTIRPEYFLNPKYQDNRSIHHQYPAQMQNLWTEDLYAYFSVYLWSKYSELMVHNSADSRAMLLFQILIGEFDFHIALRQHSNQEQSLIFHQFYLTWK